MNKRKQRLEEKRNGIFQRAYTVVQDTTDELNGLFDQYRVIYNTLLHRVRKEYVGAKHQNRPVNFAVIESIFKNPPKLLKDTHAVKVCKGPVRGIGLVLKLVKDDWEDYLKALTAYGKHPNKHRGEPKPPNYKKPGHFPVLQFDKQMFNKNMVDKTTGKRVEVPENILNLSMVDYMVTLPEGLKREQVLLATLKRMGDKVSIGLSYKKQVLNRPKLDPNKWLAIDIGGRNIVACTTDNSIGESFIVRSGIINSINEKWNMERNKYRSLLATVNMNKDGNCPKTSKRLDKLSTKREARIKYQFDCISRMIVDYCIEHGIGRIIIGRNKYWKSDISHRRKVNRRNRRSNIQNRKFVGIPHYKLIEKIKYKAEEYGINVVETEESYTSITDHLALEPMKKINPEDRLGKRPKYGIYISSTGKRLNADINGAMGMARKDKRLTDDDLIKFRDRNDISSPTARKVYQRDGKTRIIATGRK